MFQMKCITFNVYKKKLNLLTTATQIIAYLFKNC